MFKTLFMVLFSLGPLFAGNPSDLKSGIEKENFDESVRPADDFYRYVNGTSLKNSKIPADRSVYGTFIKLIDSANKNQRSIIEDAAQIQNKSVGSDEQKVGDYFVSYMDSLMAERQGISPLKPHLEKINSVLSYADLTNLMADFTLIGVQKQFEIWVEQDLKDSDRYLTYVAQDGLGLPNRDYYFDEGEKFKDIRTRYKEYIENLLNATGIENAKSKARKIMTIETYLAKYHWTSVENRDYEKTYNKYEIAKMNELTPDFDWRSYLMKVGINREKEIIVQQPSYFKSFNTIFKKVSINDWKTYLTYKLISSRSPKLSKKFVDLNFDFYGKTLSGRKKNRPRWKRAVSSTNSAMGEIVGKVYVKKYFKPEAKARMLELVENLKKSFSKRIEKLEWMSQETKNEALKKLNNFTAKIGYPDEWKDYSKLVIDRNDLIGNMDRYSKVNFERDVAKLGKPVDKNEWFMNPQDVNAYYYPPLNEVVFPAGILRAPFFNMEADDAVNYGAIGAVIGHELTHGFDDQGRKVDANGNMNDWWTEADNKKFLKRADVIVNQYNLYNPVDTMHVNGKLTLGENIADLGGLTIAYYAYKMSLNGKEAPIIDGLTGEQRFFVGFAQVWNTLYRSEYLRQLVIVDPHSPAEYRCNGIVSNMPEFYKAFDVKKGDPMFRTEDIRVNIW